MNKINVIGTSGSGKSTFAKALAKRLGYPYIEMDAIFWGANWTESTDADFFPKLQSALKRKNWVLDGNYKRTTHIKWKEVDTVIWLDFNFALTFYQAVTRAFNRVITGEEIWLNTNNREKFRMLFSKDSIVLWTLKTYGKNRIKYLSNMQDPEYDQITFIQLKNRKECKDFLRNLGTKKS